MQEKYLLILLSCLLPLLSNAQLMRAQLKEGFTIELTKVSEQEPELRNNTFDQLPGFPKQVVANPAFKNFRNVTLADINNDGVEEILWAANDRLYAYAAEELLWEKELSGVAIYPPSVADMDGDGQLEIVQATGGTLGIPLLYLLDSNGEDAAGWPLSLNNNWVLSAPALSDLDGDGVMEIIACELDSPGGYVHALEMDGSTVSMGNWPVLLDGPPAVTPSVGDVNGDGALEVVIHSSKSKVILDREGSFSTGFPITTGPQQRYSYQSPLIYDFEGMGMPTIIGASHGDDPQFYSIDGTGNDRTGWPIDVPENTWSYSTPTLVEIDSEPWIFMSRRLNGSEESPMLFAWDGDGNLKPGFPVSQLDGLEGIISVADVDGDNEYELVFGSDLFQSNGNTGFIHAYELDGSGEVDGFPVLPPGMTYLNGVALGDVNNDGMMDMTALSYTSNFGQATDSIYLNCYDLGVPYSSEKVLWSTYKGSNSRDGWLNPPVSTDVESVNKKSVNVVVAPNPTSGSVYVEVQGMQHADWQIEVVSIDGLESAVYGPYRGAGTIQLDISTRRNISYCLLIKDTKGQVLSVPQLLYIVR